MFAEFFFALLVNQASEPARAEGQSPSARESVPALSVPWSLRAVPRTPEAAIPEEERLDEKEFIVEVVDSATSKPIEGCEFRLCDPFEELGFRRGASLANAAVTPEHLRAVMELSPSAITDSSGRAQVRISARGYWVFARAGNRWSVVTDRDLISTGGREPLELSRFGEASVELRTPEGQPLAGLSIRTSFGVRSVPFVVLTDKQGRADLLVLDSWRAQSRPVTVGIHGPGFPFHELPPAGKVLSLELQEPGSIQFMGTSGVDPERLHAWGATGLLGFSFWPSMRGIVDAWPIPAGGPVRLNLSGFLNGQYGTYRYDSPRLKPGQVLGQPVASLDLQPAIRVRVLNPTGDPLANRRVWMTHQQVPQDYFSRCGVGLPWLGSADVPGHESLIWGAEIRSRTRFETDQQGYVELPIAEDWRWVRGCLGILRIYDGLPERATLGAELWVREAGPREVTDMGEVRLKPFGLIVEGTAVDSLGQPVVGIPVQVREFRPPGVPQDSPARGLFSIERPARDRLRRDTVRRDPVRGRDGTRAHTDESGRFRFEGFPRDVPIQVLFGYSDRHGLSERWSGREFSVFPVHEGTSNLQVVLPDKPAGSKSAVKE